MTMLGHNSLIDKAWKALKEECCSDPKRALRCVMVSREQFEKALRLAMKENTDG